MFPQYRKVEERTMRWGRHLKIFSVYVYLTPHMTPSHIHINKINEFNTHSIITCSLNFSLWRHYFTISPIHLRKRISMRIHTHNDTLSFSFSILSFHSYFYFPNFHSHTLTMVVIHISSFYTIEVIASRTNPIFYSRSVIRRVLLFLSTL